MLAILLASCGTAQNRKSVAKLKKLVSAGDYKKALELTKSDKFYKEDNSKLLKLVEVGTLQNLNGQYFQSLQSFDEAKELSRQLFTKSIRKKILSGVGNDSADNYYGDLHERSLIRFYQALNHYMLHQVGKYEAHKVKPVGDDQKKMKEKMIPEKVLSEKEKRNHLIAARSIFIEWDSLLDEYKGISGGEVVYKDDLIAKLFGAFIHEQLGTGEDRQIALGLYREAKKILFRNYNIYPSFNKLNKKFKKDFSKLPQMSLNNVKSKYVKETKYSKDLLEYINRREKHLKKGHKDNLILIVQSNFIAEKFAKKFEFPINLVTLPAGVSNKNDFLSFSLKVLQLGAASQPKISFELPAIKKKQVKTTMKLLLEGKKKEEIDLVLLDPLSEIAELALENDIVSTRVKTGTRVAGKHLAALLTSYGTYKTAKKGMGDAFALLTASATYAAANKGIEMSERADLRSWVTLPNSIQMTSLKLKPGKYKAKLEITQGDVKRLRNLGDIEIIKGKAKLLTLRD